MNGFLNANTSNVNKAYADIKSMKKQIDSLKSEDQLLNTKVDTVNQHLETFKAEVANNVTTDEVAANVINVGDSIINDKGANISKISSKNVSVSGLVNAENITVERQVTADNVTAPSCDIAYIRGTNVTSSTLNSVNGTFTNKVKSNNIEANNIDTVNMTAKNITFNDADNSVIQGQYLDIRAKNVEVDGNLTAEYISLPTLVKPKIKEIESLDITTDKVLYVDEDGNLVKVNKGSLSADIDSIDIKQEITNPKDSTLQYFKQLSKLGQVRFIDKEHFILFANTSYQSKGTEIYKRKADGSWGDLLKGHISTNPVNPEACRISENEILIANNPNKITSLSKYDYKNNVVTTISIEANRWDGFTKNLYNGFNDIDTDPCLYDTTSKEILHLNTGLIETIPEDKIVTSTVKSKLAKVDDYYYEIGLKAVYVKEAAVFASATSQLESFTGFVYPDTESTFKAQSTVGNKEATDLIIDQNEPGLLIVENNIATSFVYNNGLFCLGILNTGPIIQETFTSVSFDRFHPQCLILPVDEDYLFDYDIKPVVNIDKNKASFYNTFTVNDRALGPDYQWYDILVDSTDQEAVNRIGQKVTDLYSKNPDIMNIKIGIVTKTNSELTIPVSVWTEINNVLKTPSVTTCEIVAINTFSKKYGIKRLSLTHNMVPVMTAASSLTLTGFNINISSLNGLLRATFKDCRIYNSAILRETSTNVFNSEYSTLIDCDIFLAVSNTVATNTSVSFYNIRNSEIFIAGDFINGLRLVLVGCAGNRYSPKSKITEIVTDAYYTD